MGHSNSRRKCCPCACRDLSTPSTPSTQGFVINVPFLTRHVFECIYLAHKDLLSMQFLNGQKIIMDSNTVFSTINAELIHDCITRYTIVEKSSTIADETNISKIPEARQYTTNGCLTVFNNEQNLHRIVRYKMKRQNKM